jgi:type II secretory pathway pseudopilin PulG
MIELMVVSAILMITMVVGFPAISNLIHRSRMVSYTQEAAIHIAKARQEAIRRGVPVVVQPRFAERDLFTWANVDRDAALAYAPNDAAPHGTVDYQVGPPLPIVGAGGVSFHGPADAAPDGPDVIDGLTPVAAGENGIVFDPDGSVQTVGAIRISDERGNFLEIRVGPSATGRVRILKYNPDPSWGDPAGFFEKGIHQPDGKAQWIWY